MSLPLILFDVLVKYLQKFDRMDGPIDLASDCISIFKLFRTKQENERGWHDASKKSKLYKLFQFAEQKSSQLKTVDGTFG